MDTICNSAELTGTLAGSPVFSHIGGGEDFYKFPLSVSRLSGKCDTINIILRRSLMERCELSEEKKLSVSGEIRTFNNRSGEGSKLVINVLARELTFCSGDDENRIALNGVICREPIFRRTPLGRQICDVMLSAPRSTGRSDYIPVITWGRTAIDAAELTVGSPVHVEGRLQSRIYKKNIDGVQTERTAFEVSAAELTRLYV